MNKNLFTGKITGIKSVKEGETKNGKKWAKREFVVQEEGDKFPQSAKFSMFKMDDHRKYVTGFENQFAVGDTVTVEFKLETSNNNGTTYNNINCWRIDKVEGSASDGLHDEGPLFS